MKKREGKGLNKRQRSKGKVRVRLSAKLLLVVMLPILLIASVSTIKSIQNEKSLSSLLLKQEMSTALAGITEIIDALGEGDIVFEEGLYKKGDYNIADLKEVLVRFSETSNVDVALYYETQLMVSSMEDNSSTDDNTYAKVRKGSAFYRDNLMLGKEPCFCYFGPLKQETGRIIGSICIFRPVTEINQMMAAGALQMILFVTVFTIATAIAAYVILKLITKKIEATVKNLNEVAEGSLKVVISDKLKHRTDEIGDIAFSMCKVVNSFKDILRGINTSSEELTSFTSGFRQSFGRIYESLSQINTTIEGIAKTATSQASETVNATGEINNIGSAIEEVSDKVGLLEESSRKMEAYSDNTNVTFKEMVQMSQTTKTHMEAMREKTYMTNQSVQEIQKATELIAQISEQTNLLSLNASIEAARAGEMGRGFAVVATEIRNLSDQSRKSTEIIGKVLGTLLINSNTSVEAINGVFESLIHQEDKLEKSLKTFERLQSEIQKVMESIAGIKAKTEDVQLLKGEIQMLIEGMAAIAEENAASTQETSASVTYLHEVVDQCNGETERMARLVEVLSQGVNRFEL